MQSDDLQANFKSKLFLMELPKDGRDGSREKRCLENAFSSHKSHKILAFCIIGPDFLGWGTGIRECQLNHSSYM